jgi:hypothetical protein
LIGRVVTVVTADVAGTVGAGIAIPEADFVNSSTKRLVRYKRQPIYTTAVSRVVGRPKRHKNRRFLGTEVDAKPTNSVAKYHYQ